jgi:hypothetical protein
MEMKNKTTIAIVIASLLLTTSGILTSGVQASGGDVFLKVEPDEVVYDGIAYGKVFTVNLNVGNVTNLFGYAFNVTWDHTLLECTVAVATPPASWNSHYIVAVNQIASGQCLLAVVALNGNGATPFTGNATLALLTFKVIYDPLATSQCPLHLGDGTLLSDDGGNKIDATLRDGLYIHRGTGAVVKMLEPNYCFGAEGMEFTAEIWVFNISGLDRFVIWLFYNATLLDATLPEPGTIFPLNFTAAMAPGRLLFRSERFLTGNHTIDMCNPAFDGSGCLGKVNFTTRLQPTNATCVLTLGKSHYNIELRARNPYSVENSNYKYVMLQGDVNGDVNVNLKDIFIVAKAYGSRLGDPKWDDRADQNGDGKIDLMDFMISAIKFGNHV